jgi:hypothetical protein
LNYRYLYLILIAKNSRGETLLRLPLMLDSRLRVNSSVDLLLAWRISS